MRPTTTPPKPDKTVPVSSLESSAPSRQEPKPMTASQSGRTTQPSPVPAGRPKGKGKVKVSKAQRRRQRKQKTIANPQQPMREKAMSTTPLPKQTDSISTMPNKTAAQ